MDCQITHAFAKTFVLGFLLALPSNALIVKLTDLETMAKRSDIVIHGYVGDQTVTNDDLGRLITLTYVEVIESLHGAKTGEVITIYQVGGQKDGIVMPLLGGQRYTLGTEVLLFGLKMDDAYVSYGAGQGKLDIIGENGKEEVIEDLGNVSSISAFSKEPFAPSPLSFSSKVLLKDEIKEMLKSK